MATVTKLTVIKKFTYRGNAEEFSNSYYLSGTVPSDAAAWRTLFDAMVVAEKPCYPAAVTVIRGYGHDSDDPHAVAVWSVDLTVSPETPVAGTDPVTGGLQLPGDTAVWVRWKTDRLNTNGKPIYLRKYFHPGRSSTGGSTDVVLGSTVTLLNTFATKLADGSFAGGRTIRSGAHSETILSHGASAYNTTRTLKRRGKRP